MAKKEQAIGANERKKMEVMRKRLLAKSAKIRDQRRQVLESDLLKQVEASEDALRKLPLSSRKKFAEHAEAVNDHIERMFPLSARPLWQRAHAWWKFRKIRKQMLHHARVSRCMREDILDPELVANCQAAEKAFKKQAIVGDFLAFSKAGEALNEIVEEINPSRNRSRFGENLEVAVVAIAVALGARTYFIQPFKIPTGSMQPTLYGQTFEPGETTLGLVDKPWIPIGLTQNRFAEFANPLRLVKGFTTGRWYREYRAPMDGILRPTGVRTQMNEIQFVFINGSRQSRPFFIHEKFPGLEQAIGQAYEKGQLIVAGTKVSGDHILVNKVKYNYRRPKRGDIFVFSVRNVDFSGVSPEQIYIKRLVGMPGESITVDTDRRILADGEPVTDPRVFRRQYLRTYDGRGRLYRKELETEQGVKGYSRAGRVVGGQEIELTDRQYLPMGDNTDNSLDGRYFGGIERTDIVGPAGFIYWPFFRFGGMDRDLKHWGDQLDATGPAP